MTAEMISLAMTTRFYGVNVVMGVHPTKYKLCKGTDLRYYAYCVLPTPSPEVAVILVVGTIIP